MGLKMIENNGECPCHNERKTNIVHVVITYKRINVIATCMLKIGTANWLMFLLWEQGGEFESHLPTRKPYPT